MMSNIERISAINRNICATCKHSRDNHLDDEQCSELIQTGGFRAPPKICQCDHFEDPIRVSRRELFRKLLGQL